MFKTLPVIAATMLLCGSAAPTEARTLIDHTTAHIAIEKEAVETIEQVEEVARDVNYHTDRLMEMAQNYGVSHWSHYHHLDVIKALVNDGLHPALKTLRSVQTRFPEWKQDAIDRMIADAQQLANDMNSAYIAKSNGASLPPAMNDTYKRFIADVAGHAASLAKTADAAHGFAVGHLEAAEAGLKGTN